MLDIQRCIRPHQYGAPLLLRLEVVNTMQNRQVFYRAGLIQPHRFLWDDDFDFQFATLGRILFPINRKRKRFGFSGSFCVLKLQFAILQSACGTFKIARRPVEFGSTEEQARM